MTHTGRPIIIQPRGLNIIVLCPQRHVIKIIPGREWAKSIDEAQLGDPTYQVTCDGTEETP